CDRHGALLIFDEVMTGFRVSAGGAQERLHVRPDLTTLGKIIGGGMPVGAYGGRADLMRLVAPEGPVYQAGTLAGNPVAMAAGRAGARRVPRAFGVRGRIRLQRAYRCRHRHHHHTTRRGAGRGAGSLAPSPSPAHAAGRNPPPSRPAPSRSCGSDSSPVRPVS